MRLLVAVLTCLLPVFTLGAATDSLAVEGEKERSGHRLEVDYVPGGIIHTNEFLNGSNPEKRTMNHSTSTRVKYAFVPPESSWQAKVYRGVYHGLGVAFHEFNPQLSNPTSVFIFQGGRIASLARRLAFNYEWNFGLTFGWKPYDKETNPDNRVIGSRTTAYLDADFYLSYRINRWLDLNAGLSVAHFSNGNTAYPNGGLNTWGARVGLAAYLNRESADFPLRQAIPPFQRHFTYDLVLFGAWRRCGVAWDDGRDIYAVPGTFGVFGLNFNPMYNISHWFNAGLSLDYVYDRSTNLYFPDGYLDMDKLTAPSAAKQMAVGLSARAEFVMPYFTINMGIGTNVINARGDFKGVYEMLALKMHVYRASFIHIGYCLSDFKYPNYLMLGVGYTFNYRRRF